MLKPIAHSTEQNKKSTSRRTRFAEAVVESAQIMDKSVQETLLFAFSTVERERFLVKRYHTRAFDDVAFPIGFEQSVHRPSDIARMLSLVGVRKKFRLLEIGTGSGYSAALASAAGASVYTVERIGLLAQQTRKQLDKMNLGNILVCSGDGRRGWKDHAPFDAILSWVAFHEIPAGLTSQLIPEGGRLVFPLNDGDTQRIVLLETRPDQNILYRMEESQFPLAS